MPKKKKILHLSDVYEDLSDLSRVLSYEMPQITDKEIVKRLDKDIEVLDRVMPFIEQFHLEEFADEVIAQEGK